MLQAVECAVGVRQCVHEVCGVRNKVRNVGGMGNPAGVL